jgi:hypothetical protein
VVEEERPLGDRDRRTMLHSLRADAPVKEV